MLTTSIIVKNNEKTIRETLKSIVSLGNIIIGNDGSTDKAISICKEFPVKIYDLPKKNKRNFLLEKGSDFNFYIEPWEVLTNGHQEIKELKTGSYQIKLFQNNLITKEIRFHNKHLKFTNPVFETLIDNNAILLNKSLIYVKENKSDYVEQLKEINEWKSKNLMLSDPYYYQACILLQMKKYDDFIPIASHYLFLEKNGFASLMLKYYLSLVYFNKNDLNNAFQHIVGCLATKPLMAEFWCVLGDIFYKTKDYKRALYLYDNAVILGSKRLMTDEFPIEIKKYKEYPKKMIESCEKLLLQKT